MKFSLAPLSWSLAVALACGMTEVVSAAEVVVPTQQVEATQAVFQVDEFVLVREADVLTQKTQQHVLSAMAFAKGPNRNLDVVNAAIQKAQSVLEQVAPGAFVLSLAPQTIYDKGNVLVLVRPVLSKVTVKGLSDDDLKEALDNLPPTLQKGATLSGEKWPSPQTLGILNDHPLKVTTIQYNVERDKPVSAEVQVMEPFGKSQSTVTVDTFGNQVIGRGMLTVSHLQSDVGTRDDVLSVSGSTSLHSPGQVSVATLRYTVPDMSSFTSHSVGLGHSQSHVDMPFLFFGNVTGKGSYNELSYRQTHFLNWGQDLGLSSTKFIADVVWNRSHASTSFLNSTLAEYSVSSLPVTLGLESMLNSGASNADDWVKDFSAFGRAQVVVNKAGLISSQSEFQQARTDAGSSRALRLFLDTHTTLSDQARLNVMFSGQFSDDKLLPSTQMTIAGDRMGVRGFINSVLLGDAAQVLRSEIEPLVMRSKWDAYVTQPYVFYDVGHKRGGNDERALLVSSRGVGMRLTPVQTKGFSLDVFGARKIHGATLDLMSGSTNEVSKTTYWATGTYRF